MARPKPIRDRIKILKKAARNNPHKDVRYYYPDHPFIAGYSIPEDEVSLAVEKLNKAFNQSDNYQRPQWMWISGPLEDSKISLLEQFVGQGWQEKESNIHNMSDVIMLAYQHRTKEKFLGLLKSKLRRCCNIQNPDTLTWEEIFAAINEYISGKHEKGGQGRAKKPTEASGAERKKAAFKKALKIIGAIVGFLAALLAVLNYLGCLEPIKTFIYRILLPK
jgi:hypothetical protein